MKMVDVPAICKGEKVEVKGAMDTLEYTWEAEGYKLGVEICFIGDGVTSCYFREEPSGEYEILSYDMFVFEVENYLWMYRQPEPEHKQHRQSKEQIIRNLNEELNYKQLKQMHHMLEKARATSTDFAKCVREALEYRYMHS